MKSLNFKYGAFLLLGIMGVALTGCQQGSQPPAVVVEHDQAPSTSEQHTTTTDKETKQVETPDPNNPDGSVKTKTSQENTTTVDKSKQQ